MKPRPHPEAPARRQRGAALLTAMIIVTLIVTLAASMVWQQWRAVQVEAAERSRSQSAWILSGALDWARLILREDARGGAIDHLGEPWAVPLAEARLSTFLAADKDNTDDAPEAFLSGSISDAQSRYNLNNLIVAGKIEPSEMAVLQRLCQTVGVSAELAEDIAEGLRDSITPPADRTEAAEAPLPPRRLSQLAWLGVDANTLRLLEPHVVLLPGHTPVNANTASREVLAAVIPGIDLATAERMVQTRQREPFAHVESVAKIIGPGRSLLPQSIDVTSNFFEVRGRLRLGDRVLEQRSLVQRRALEVLVLQREQVSSRE